jgi:hypothetical protein
MPAPLVGPKASIQETLMAQFNIRDLPVGTERQIERLVADLGYTKTQLVIIAIDRLYRQQPGVYVSADLTDRQITYMLKAGGFEPLERTDVQSMNISGYTPDSGNPNPTFNFTVNDDDTGFEIRWDEIPASIKRNLR